ncbi:MAG TPA: hypothetical protein PLL78_04510 [Fimbriimonadaceae bacterium]|nr:hypothetical protein [Fimbriimonadaceae bacterium]HRJ95925.1 hypothetical protein [Fimbriimonadaceae bacterium]
MFNVWPALILLLLQGSCGAELSVRQVHLIAALVQGRSFAECGTKRLSRSEVRLVFAERALAAAADPLPCDEDCLEPTVGRCLDSPAADPCEGFLVGGKNRDGP